jgi:allophanate hydrolase subunit 2
MGGYPKIATAALADLSHLAQLLPGDKVRFRIVLRTEARAAYVALLETDRRKALTS